MCGTSPLKEEGCAKEYRICGSSEPRRGMNSEFAFIVACAENASGSTNIALTNMYMLKRVEAGLVLLCYRLAATLQP